MITSAIAGEVHKGPFQAAQEAIKQHGYTDKILLRMGNGLEILNPHDEVNVVTIAGMGGATIVDILSRYPEVTSSLSKIILQPMNAAALVRQWLLENHWMIEDEALVKEDGRLYEIITAVQGEQVISEQILLDIGPLIWSKRLPFLAEHLQFLRDQSIRVLSEMDASPSARISQKYSYYAQKIKDLELKMSCL
ncbi:SAM-dependent methyltransferase [bacterium BFN5]|nr:SAM-dependent methyltransferase [bacterium BFN5]